MNNADFAELVLSQVAKDRAFTPTAYYDPDGDCIEFIAAPDSFYGERIDTLVTVYRSQENHEIVGSLIKGVRKFLRKVLVLRKVLERSPGFKIEIREGRIKLTHLFTAKLWTEEMDPNALPGITYQKLREKAEETGAEVEVGELLLAS